MEMNAAVHLTGLDSGTVQPRTATDLIPVMPSRGRILITHPSAPRRSIAVYTDQFGSYPGAPWNDHPE